MAPSPPSTPSRHYAPWTPQQVEALTRHQNTAMHPHLYVCDTHDRDPVIALEATKDGWRCPLADCDYKQTWALAQHVTPEDAGPDEQPGTWKSFTSALDAQRQDSTLETLMPQGPCLTYTSTTSPTEGVTTIVDRAVVEDRRERAICRALLTHALQLLDTADREAS